LSIVVVDVALFFPLDVSQSLIIIIVHQMAVAAQSSIFITITKSSICIGHPKTCPNTCWWQVGWEMIRWLVSAGESWWRQGRTRWRGRRNHRLRCTCQSAASRTRRQKCRRKRPLNPLLYAIEKRSAEFAPNLSRMPTRSKTICFQWQEGLCRIIEERREIKRPLRIPLGRRQFSENPWFQSWWWRMRTDGGFETNLSDVWKVLLYDARFKVRFQDLCRAWAIPLKWPTLKDDWPDSNRLKDLAFKGECSR